MTAHRPAHTASQRGLATLVVVMMLFLVMALLAAYANRALLFEQRSAASHARASLAQEVAEGGIEWLMAQLNGPAADTACRPAATGGKRFADRYLHVDAADRSIRLLRPYTDFVADCTRDMAGDGWACRCPELPAGGGRIKPAPMGGNDSTPSFGIRLRDGLRGGTFNAEVIACSQSVVDDCSDASAAAQAENQHALSAFSATIALVSAVRNPPAAPLIVKGALTVTGPGLGLHNTDPRSAGLLLITGGQQTGLQDGRLRSVPGTSPDQVRLQNDATLAGGSANQVFTQFMGVKPTRYPQHPALRKLVCSGDCTGALLAAYDAGQRMIWVDGPMSLSSNQVIGSVTDPVLVIADSVQLAGPLQLTGMLVSRSDLSWVNASGLPSVITGMVLALGQMRTEGSMDIAYQQAVADQLRNRVGSHVRVPGGWTDSEVTLP